METEKYLLIESMCRHKEVDPKKFSVRVLDELVRYGYINGTKNTKGEYAFIRKGINFDKAVAKFMDKFE